MTEKKKKTKLRTKHKTKQNKTEKADHINMLGRFYCFYFVFQNFKFWNTSLRNITQFQVITVI